MFSRKGLITGLILVSLSLLVSACIPNGVQPTPVAATLPPQPTEILPTPTATVPAARSLTICLGQEPSSLYLYKSSSKSTWSVLEAVYDGPFDTRSFSAQPVILQKMPSLKDGDAAIAPVAVQNGQKVVDANGDIVNLTKGDQVLPSGCSGPDCAVPWDGSSPLQMDQLTVKFKLLPNLKWSDGSPLTSSDLIYSYQLSTDPATPVSQQIAERTASYQAIDAQTVQWVGQPGFIPADYDTLFWTPLPKHLWGSMSASDLLNSDDANRFPLGWGPYIIKDWVAGDHITLVKNPNYFRASEGLPKFDTLVYRFLGEPADNNLAALLTGECDIVDQTSLLDEQLETVLELQQSHKLKAYIGQGPDWEHIDFGIKPASYDKGYTSSGGMRPDFFSDLRMRQAFAYCMDRQGIVNNLLKGQSSVPASYLPPSHPLFMKDLTPLPFDVAKGRSLLDQVGWKVVSGDPKAPRQSVGVANVADGTALSVNYFTTEAALRVDVAKLLADSLAQCGIQINVQYLNPGDLFAQAPDGVLFGRKFDLAQFSWETGAQPPCLFYQTDQIPSDSNNWLGVNITGFSNPDYDAACEAAQSTRPDQTDAYIKANQDAQRLFAEQLPVIPLFFRLDMAVSRPDMCGMQMDVTARSDLWNLESLDYGNNCQ